PGLDGKLLKFPDGNDVNALEQTHRNVISFGRELCSPTVGDCCRDIRWNDLISLVGILVLTKHQAKKELSDERAGTMLPRSLNANISKRTNRIHAGSKPRFENSGFVGLARRSTFRGCELPNPANRCP